MDKKKIKFMRDYVLNNCSNPNSKFTKFINSCEDVILFTIYKSFIDMNHTYVELMNDYEKRLKEVRV